MRIDCGNSCTQRLIRWNEDNIRVVCGERFGVINRGDRTTEGVVFYQSGGHELVSGPQNVGERDA